MKIIAVSNQKGGVSKSTTSQALTTILNDKGKKTLAIDMDPQANLTFAMGAYEIDRPSIYDVLKGNASAEDILKPTSSGDILPASILLSAADTEFMSTGREYLLKESLLNIRSRYEYIIIDCPPALNILTLNAFTVTDYVVIPALADVFSLQGLTQLHKTIMDIKKYCNPNIKILGILLTKYAHRTTLSSHMRDTLDHLSERLDTRLFTTCIRESIVVREAQLKQSNMLEYDRKCNAMLDYVDFVNELEGMIDGR